MRHIRELGPLAVLTALVATAASPAQAAAVPEADQPVGSNTVVSVRPDGTSSHEHDSELSSVSSGGRYVAFLSREGGLVPGTEGGADKRHVYLRDRRTGVTTLIDVRPDGVASKGRVEENIPSVSADGRYVAFVSQGADIAPGASTVNNVFVRDTVTGVTTLASATLNGKPADLGSNEPEISGDGSTVVFTSAANNLVPGRSRNRHEIYRRDLLAGITTLVSKSPKGRFANGYSQRPTMSSDGRLIAYDTDATNVVSGGYPDGDNVILYDLAADTSTLVNRPADGARPDGSAYGAELSSQGQTVVYSSFASNLAPRDTNESIDVFAHDISTGSTTLVSRSLGGESGDANSFGATVDGDGTLVAFASFADDLVAGDTNHVEDVFVVDLATETTTVISRTDKGEPANEKSQTPAFSGDGSIVTYTSRANNIVPGTTLGVDQVYAYRVG